MKLGAILVVAALAACGGGSNGAQDGALGGKCFPNSTCNAGLMCSGGVCEMGIDIDAAIPHDSDVVHDAPLDGFLGHPDSSILPDAVIPDSGVLPDAFVPDGGVMTDGGVTPDGTVMTDGGVTPDGALMTDSGVLPDAATGTCDPLAQTGCTASQKCTWIDDTATSGHIGCVANGAMATGAACTFGAVGPSTGFDNCVRGDYCNGGKCETLCDPTGGTPTCDASHACQSYDGLFGVSGGPSSAGLCDPSCNPLDDNDFDGSGAVHTKIGTACGSDPTIGCYGIVTATAPPTHFSCASPAGGTAAFHHRAVLAANQQFLNSCAPGYTIAFATDAFGSNNVDCYAFCKPGESYLNNPNAQAPNGVSPHGCNTTDALGAFGAVPTAVNNGTNGEHCMYSWFFEIDDTTGVHLDSPTSNTVGICWDHSKYRYDSNNDGAVTAADAIIPACTSLPLTSGSGGLTAGDVGCVTTTTAGVSFTGKPAKLHRVLTNLPELPAFQRH